MKIYGNAASLKNVKLKKNKQNYITLWKNYLTIIKNIMIKVLLQKKKIVGKKKIFSTILFLKMFLLRNLYKFLIESVLFDTNHVQQYLPPTFNHYSTVTITVAKHATLIKRIKTEKTQQWKIRENSNAVVRELVTFSPLMVPLFRLWCTVLTIYLYGIFLWTVYNNDWYYYASL